MGRIFVEDTICGPRILFQRIIGLGFSCMQLYERYCCPIVSNIDETTIRISGTAILFEGRVGPDRYIVILPNKNKIKLKRAIHTFDYVRSIKNENYTICM